jgi:hypothetical protein
MKTKSIFIVIFFLFYTNSLIAQINTNTFDNSLKQLTDELSIKLTKVSTSKMAVWDLSDLNGGVSSIGKYIAEDISINLSDKFHITNRNQLNTLLKENQLSSEGFINQATFKQVKKLSDIDIIITGIVTILSENIKITLQALDVDGNIVGAVKGDVPLNADVKELLGINTGTSNKGFNRSLNSSEQLNNPKTVSKDCETKNTGDYCFLNNTNRIMYVTVYIHNQGTLGEISVDPGQTQCLYNIDATTYDYVIGSKRWSWHMSDAERNGQIQVTKCQSKTFIIR